MPMSIQMERKHPRAVNLEKHLRVQTKLDLLFNDNAFRDQADVRSSTVLEITPKVLVLAQTSPPILKSMINRDVEASFVGHDALTSERARWGWNSRILGLNNEYIQESSAPNSPPQAAVYIAFPVQGGLRATNMRLDYRLEVNNQDKIYIRTSPPIEGAKVLNFSAGGALIALPGPPRFQTGAQMHIHLIFPWPDKNSKTSVRSRAEVVRVTYNSLETHSQVGLKFQEMDIEASRVFSKIINHYMLAEQRRRNVDF